MGEYEQAVLSTSVEYSRSKPILLFATEPQCRARAEVLLYAAGGRLVDCLPVDEGAERLEHQVSLGLAWLELGADDATPALDGLLSRLNDLAELRGTAVVAVTSAQMIDTVAARLTAGTTEILVDPDDAQRAATLALALSHPREANCVHDVGSDNAARLRKLSDEMGRIASTLARLSTGPDGPAVTPSEAKEPAPATDIESVRAVIRARRLRTRFFSDELFADPAWDMLLELLQAEIAQARVSVSSLCIASAVPATTALRWIKTMTEQGLFVRRGDAHDGRRVFIELAPAASHAMRRYFDAVGRPGIV